MKLLKINEKRIGAAGGTFFAVISAFIVKAIGGLYKIPLYNALGDNATGLYGMIFPLLAFLLCISGSGVPIALTRLIADGYDAKRLLKKGIILFGSTGLFLSVLLVLSSGAVAKLQGEIGGAALYKAVAPSVFLVAIIAVFRGVFQGISNMRVTAVSQLIEQCVRAVIGLIGAYLLPIAQNKKAIFAVACVTFSEVVALIYCVIRYKKSRHSFTAYLTEKSITYKGLIGYVFPFTFSSVLIPLSGMAEGLIALRALNNLSENGTALYGLYAGAVGTIISLPAAILHPFACGFLPSMSVGERAKLPVLLTAVCSLFAMIFTLIFADIIVGLLFPSSGYKATLSALLRFSSLSIFLLPMLQTTSFVLIADGRCKRSLFNNGAGCIVKILVCAILVYKPQINVFAIAFSDICCYFVALTLNLIYIIYVKTDKGRIDNDSFSGIGGRERGVIPSSVQGNSRSGQGVLQNEVYRKRVDF